MAFRADTPIIGSVSARINRHMLILAICSGVVLAAGCGGDEPTVAPAPTVTATPSATASATPTATATATPTPTPTATTSPEDQPGGAGDEEPARVPLEFTLDDSGLKPKTISVPAFLGLELIVHNRTGQPQRVVLEGSGELDAPANDTARVRFEGRRAGTYEVDAGAAGHAQVIVGVEPGP
jgi:hypothetical protein